ncbi:MAG: CHAT domain-containing protein [Phaeodactylibacter sp.]|nr:CHAT domain-containing protein [Phaeodactylibacter sp.]
MYTPKMFRNITLAMFFFCLLPTFLPGQACDSLNAIAEVHFSNRDFQAFFLTTQAAKAACSEEYGEAHPKYVQALSNWGVALSKQSRYREEREVLEQALELAQPYKDSHPDMYAEVLNNLGYNYRVLGFRKKALELYQESLKMKPEPRDSQTALSYAKTLWNLAILYSRIGMPEEAWKCLDEARALMEQYVGKESSHYGTALHQLATFYHNAGLYERALEYALAAKENLLQTHPDIKVDMAGTLYQIGIIFERMKQYEKAISYYEQVHQLAEEIYGKNHGLYAYYTNSLASGYKHLGQYDKALEYSREALEIAAAVFGEEHPRYGDHVNDLASIYYERGQYAVADSLMKIALANKFSNFGLRHRERRFVTRNYGVLCDKRGDYSTALQYYQEANAIMHDEIERHFGTFNENERERFLAAVEKDFQIYQYFTLKAKEETPQAQGMIYDDALALKGLLLHSSENVLAALRKNPDTSLALRYANWIGLKGLIAAQYSLPIISRAYSPAELDSLERTAGHLERQLADASKAFRKARWKVHWTEVRQSLAPGEAAIEFLSFPHPEAEDSSLYCALVLRQDFEFPRLTYLFEEKQLSQMLSKEVYPTQRYIHELYTPELYRLIWQPIEEMLEGVQTVYFAPAGLLHRIAFPALRPTSSTLLANKYQLEQLSSTRKLAEEEAEGRQWQSAILFGGILYDTLAPQLLSGEEPLAAPGIAPRDEAPEGRSWNTIRDASRSTRFDTLPHTRTEVERISRLLENAGVPHQVLSEYSAGEEQFKALGRSEASPDVLHLATHGYFFGDDSGRTVPDSTADDNARELLHHSINPLLRSGLALANANLAWEKGLFRPEREDGILTAYEIANMDLSSTQLAVLSACKTGLGDIRGSEGVYGLQRAFKMAGVDYLLLTLWNIRDGEETVEFMTDFYEKCLGGIPVRQAFRETQGKMRRKYEDPYFWAPFVLVE